MVRVDPQVVCRRLGTESILVHLGTNEIFELNETAARLWELLSRDGDVSMAQSRLMEEFEVDPLLLRDEVERTLTLLTTEQLIVEVGGD